MSRIRRCFDALRASRRQALVTFVTAGDPAPSVTVPLLQGLVAAGADILELGVPFSDPMADGPVIQRASERALAKSVSLATVLDMVRDFRRADTDTPIVLMGYLNPFEAMGYQIFSEAAAEAGVDGVLTVDMPPEEAGAFVQALRGHNVDPIFLLAPTSDDERVARICSQASGFVYYVSLKGVTGAGHLDVASVADKVAEIRSQTNLPVGVGFGIRDAESAAHIARISDAVVVGSVLVQRIEALIDSPREIPIQVPRVIAEMRAAMDAGAAASG